MSTSPFFGTALRGVGPQETGSAAGLLIAVQQLGGTLGVAVIGGVCLGTADGARTAAQHALGAAAVVLAAAVAVRCGAVRCGAVAMMTARPAER